MTERRWRNRYGSGTTAKRPAHLRLDAEDERRVLEWAERGLPTAVIVIKLRSAGVEVSGRLIQRTLARQREAA